jgi:hypothetical protein
MMDEVIYILRVRAKKVNKKLSIVWVADFEENNENELINIIQYERLK